MAERAVSPEELAGRLCEGKLAALARGISLVDAGVEDGRRLHAAVGRQRDAAQVVGITGAPGAGKSSLINALIGALRRADRRVAVVAVDPSSPITGGAVLGDRTRMSEHAADAGVFIRSVSGRGHLGGLSRSTEAIVDLLAAGGWPFILLETIGTGQSEIEIAQVADVNIVIGAPGLGDDIQAVKAGVLEIADVLIVNKADLPGARRTVQDLRAMLQHRRIGRRDVPVLETIATEGRGIDELLAALDARLTALTPALRRARGQERVRRELAGRAADLVQRQVLASSDARIAELCEEILVQGGDVDEAAKRVLAWLRMDPREEERT